jgi:hypothetical protein
MDMNAILVAAGLVVASAVPSLALTVKNPTNTEQTVTFDLGSEEVEKKIAPGGSVEMKCDDRCAIRVSGYDTKAKTGDKLTIDGHFVVPEGTKPPTAEAHKK